jgi:predicted secreted protein
VFWFFILALMFAMPSTSFGQDEADQASGAEDSAPATESASRSLIWTGTGERSLTQTFPEAAVWLELEEGDRALGLFYPEARLPARGAVLVLSDEGETAASGVTGALAAGLASRGWAVLTLGLESPSPVLSDVLMRPVAEEPSAETEAGEQEAPESVMIDVMASESADDLEARYRSRISQTLQAGLAQLAERGYETPAVLGVGRASIHVTNQVLEGADAAALIWVAPQFYPVDRPDLPERLESLSTELLELYPSGAVDDQTKWSMGMRLRRAGMSGFERQPIPWLTPAPGTLGDGIASRVAAWLESRQD